MRHLIVFALLIITVACGSKKDEGSNNVSPTSGNGGSGALSCTATLPNNGAAVLPDQMVALTVTAQGGTGPYSLNGSSVFLSSTTVAKTYSNATSSNLIVQEPFQVKDATGATASCQATLTVLPANPPSNNLSCSLAVSPSVLRTNSLVSVTGTITGGKLPYVVQSFEMNGTATLNPIENVSPTQVRLSGTYGTAGQKVSILIVKDADLTAVSCGINFQVLSPPTLTLSASPSTTVETGQTVALSVSGIGFTTTPVVDFYTTEPGVTITKSGGGALVVSTDKLQHSFDVIAVATADTDSAQASIHLNFTPLVPLQCKVTRSGALKTGSDILIKVIALNGEALQLSDFQAGTNGYPSNYTSDSATVKYYSPGAKTVSLKAYSLVSGKECQNGASLTKQFTIENALTCTASVASSSVYRGTLTTINATVPSTAPFGPFYLVNLAVSPTTTWGYYGSYGNTGAYMAYFTPGTYSVTVTVQDLYGNQASCSKNQTVY